MELNYERIWCDLESLESKNRKQSIGRGAGTNIHEHGMNQRIRALAQQCWDERLDGRHFDQEQFAGLIINECILLRKEIPLVGIHSLDYEQGVWEGLQMYETAIKQHFGVEE